MGALSGGDVWSFIAGNCSCGGEIRGGMRSGKDRYCGSFAGAKKSVGSMGCRCGTGPARYESSYGYGCAGPVGPPNGTLGSVEPNLRLFLSSPVGFDSYAKGSARPAGLLIGALGSVEPNRRLLLSSPFGFESNEYVSTGPAGLLNGARRSVEPSFTLLRSSPVGVLVFEGFLRKAAEDCWTSNSDSSSSSWDSIDSSHRCFVFSYGRRRLGGGAFLESFPTFRR